MTAVVLCSVIAAPAQARPVDRGTFHDVDTHLSSEDPEWPCDLPFDVLVSVDVRGSYLLNQRAPGTLIMGRESRHGTVTYSANGHTFTNRFAVGDRDVSVTDNGDGTLTIIGQAAGRDDWYVDGTRVFHNPGMLRYELLIDHGGTPLDPSDDEFLEFVGEVRPSTGVNDGPTRDFCDDLAEFLAP